MKQYPSQYAGRKYYTRKCSKSVRMVNGINGYCENFHWSKKSILKQKRKRANQVLRRYSGDVSNGGWYKKVYDVWCEAF